MTDIEMCHLVSPTVKVWRRVWERVSVGTSEEITRGMDLGCGEKSWTALADSDFLVKTNLSLLLMSVR